MDISLHPRGFKANPGLEYRQRFQRIEWAISHPRIPPIAGEGLVKFNLNRRGVPPSAPRVILPKLSGGFVFFGG